MTLLQTKITLLLMRKLNSGVAKEKLKFQLRLLMTKAGSQMKTFTSNVMTCRLDNAYLEMIRVLE